MNFFTNSDLTECIFFATENFTLVFGERFFDDFGIDNAEILGSSHLVTIVL